MKTASRIQIALALVGMAALALAPSATAQADRYRSGTGAWDAATLNWGTATGGPYTSAWSNGGNATFEGTVGTVTLAAPISVNNITFTTASNGYTISGQTLNFIAGGSITQSVKNKKHTITSAITGSPSVSVADGTTYEGLTFAPTSGSVTLGTCTIPYENGGGDKAGLILDGTTTGNSASTVQYASGNLYGTLWKKGTGTWTVGNVDIGTVEIDVGTLIANGAVNTYYQGLKFIGGTLKGIGPINTAVTVPASGILAPGITNGTLSITAALNISAMAGGTGKLNYDLATPATSDKIAVTGSATIGTGVLGLNDFVFTNLGGMQAGVYTLITTTTGITGTLDSANLSGTIGGFPGTLQIAGNNLEWVTTGFETHINTNSPADDATTARAYEPLTATFSKPVVLGTGNITLRNLTNSTDTVILVGDSRISVSGSVLTINPGSALQWNKNYAVRIDATAIHSTTGISFAGIFDDTTWNFSTLPADPLVDALSALKSHITGAIPLSDAQIAAHKLTIDAEKSYFATNAAGIAAALDLVTTYDSVLGPLFVSRSLPVRSAVTNDIHWTLYTVMQDLMDFTYNASNITNNFSLLNGFKFGSSASFPGSCAAPADPNLTNSTTISASYLNTAGRETQGDGVGTYARKPTGTYLAPGSIATVTVPAALVNAGFKIRVCAQSSDLSNRPNIRRLERSSLVYDITALATKIASPLGGGIYIEVPWLASAGTVSVQVKNAVRAPYFSAKSIQTTTPAQWLIERASPAPWADFQTDKFMMQVPTSWIYAMPDPTQLMADWDASMDATTDLMGFPRLRGKESFYLQVDVDLKNSVFSPGYPAVNVGGFSATADYGGYNSSHYLVRGPQWVSNTVTNVEFHEQGHGFFFPKFPGEIESNVNLSYVAVLHQEFGFSLDEAFRSSLGYTNTFQTLDTTAMAWMTVFNFSPREAAMNVSEKSYQLKGHAKFVDVARLFGWDKLKIYYGSYVEDPNGTAYTTDQLLLRLSTSVGKDIRPLFAFWGVYPDDPTTLASAITAAGLTPSREIYNALLHYRTLVPANNAAFQSFALSWWGRKPTMAGAWEEREHARQWDATPLYSAGDQQRSEATNPGEIYNENSANDIRNRIQELLDLYYPSGIPADNTPPVVLTLSAPDDSVENSVSANLVATFTKDIVIGTGNITLKNLTDGTQSTIAINDASQVSVAGPVLTLNPTANLLPSKAYAIRIDATAIDDTAGNSFAGIANDTIWNFTTQSANSGLFTWDGSTDFWTSAHWNAGAGLVSGPVGNNSHNSATINGGTVTFAGNDTFGNNNTGASPVITINSGGTLASGGSFNTIWDLSLNGGTLLANGGAHPVFGAFKLSGTVTIGSSTASNISLGTGVNNDVTLGAVDGGNTTFNVTDVTNSSATDLTISTVLSTIGSPSGLIKAGAGTMTLKAANTYNGNTLVNAGTLVVDGGTIAGPGLIDIGANAATPANFMLNSGSVTAGGQFVIGAHGSTGTATINGGALQVNGSIYVAGYGEGTGTATITQTGGTVTATGGMDFGGGGPNSGVYNLNGGTLITPGLGKNGGGSTIINFNGGTLRPSTVNANFLQGHTAANVQSGGAVIDTNGFDITIAQPLGNEGGGLTKSGNGVLTLTGANTYTGATTVTAGTLALTGSSIADTNKLVISSGLVNLTNAETVNTLFFGAVQQAAGTYSGSGTGGTIASASFSGTGTLIVTSGPAAGYASWISAFLTGGLTGDITPAGDPDYDSINNMLEYVLNGNPAVSDPAILPVLVVSATDFEFTYFRLDLSLADTVQTFEYGSNLAGWVPVVIPAGPGVSTVGIATVTITNLGTTDSVKVSIPRSASAGAKLFGRLKVIK